MVEKNNEQERKLVFDRLHIILKDLLKIYKERGIGENPIIDMNTDVIDDLGVDSLESLDLMNAIEDEFQINPNVNEINYKRKIFQIVDYIIELRARKNIER